VRRVELANGFLNVSLNRVAVLKLAANLILVEQKDKYGHSEKHHGKTCIIEHTSTNPNSTVHVGNLRNSIIGNFLARLHRAVGWNVQEWFFVNDLVYLYLIV
jgi:arginyl-tRNA synthetase